MIVVCTTVNSVDIAKQISNFLLKERLAACIQMSVGVSSYIWDCLIKEEDEFYLKIKTLKSLQVEVINAIREIHSYELPEIVVLDTLYVEDKYKKWVIESCKSI